MATKRFVIVAYKIEDDCPDEYVEQRVWDAVLYGTEETGHSFGAPSIESAEIVKIIRVEAASVGELLK